MEYYWHEAMQSLLDLLTNRLQLPAVWAFVVAGFLYVVARWWIWPLANAWAARNTRSRVEPVTVGEQLKTIWYSILVMIALVSVFCVVWWLASLVQ